MATQDEHADGDEDRNPFEGIRPLAAPHDPEVPSDPPAAPRGSGAAEIEDLDAASGLLGADPLDPLKRQQRPGESQPGPDPTLPPIPPS